MYIGCFGWRLLSAWGSKSCLVPCLWASPSDFDGRILPPPCIIPDIKFCSLTKRKPINKDAVENLWMGIKVGFLHPGFQFRYWNVTSWKTVISRNVRENFFVCFYFYDVSICASPALSLLSVLCISWCCPLLGGTVPVTTGKKNTEALDVFIPFCALVVNVFQMASS